MRRLLAILGLIAYPAVGQVCDQAFTLRNTACPAGALDCTNKTSKLTHAQLDANFVNLVDLCKPFDVAATAIDVEGDWTFLGTLDVAPTTTPGVVLRDSDGLGTTPATGHGRLYGNLTTVTDSAWDFDVWLCQQAGGSEECRIYLDADAGSVVTINDVLEITPISTAPTCGAGQEGQVYADADLNLPCYCNGTNFVQMDDFSTTCS